MKKYTQKALKEMITNGQAKDISHISQSAFINLRHEKGLRQVGYSAGIYGNTGGLLQDQYGNLYAITNTFAKYYL